MNYVLRINNLNYIFGEKMKFIITFIFLFGYVFAEDMLCSEIKAKMETFEYNYTFSGRLFVNKTYSCEVHPNLIEERLYLLFTCSSNSKQYTNIIFAAECDGKVEKVSDIKRFSISSYEKDFEYLLTSFEYWSDTNKVIRIGAPLIYKKIYISSSELPKYYKEIIYLLLSRRYTAISPVEIIKVNLGLKKFSDQYILDTFDKSYQTISSPIIYCIFRTGKGTFNYEINFFPPKEKYSFCANTKYATDFITELIIEYNKIIDTKLPLFTKITLFKTTLEQLIDKYQEINSSIHSIIPGTHKLSQKTHTENVPNSAKPLLDSSVQFVPTNPIDYEMIFPDFNLDHIDSPPNVKRLKTSHE